MRNRADLHNHRLRLFDLIQQTPNLRWNLLTKRSTEIKRYLPELDRYPNVHIGVTVENQLYDFRITPGVEWISAEPLLGELDLARVIGEDGTPERAAMGPGIDWVIIGGESGHGAREMKLEWAHLLIAQCRALGVAVHFKQTGDVLARKLGLKDKSGKDPTEWPEELRVQEFPKSIAEAVR